MIADRGLEERAEGWRARAEEAERVARTTTERYLAMKDRAEQVRDRAERDDHGNLTVHGFAQWTAAERILAAADPRPTVPDLDYNGDRLGTISVRGASPEEQREP